MSILSKFADSARARLARGKEVAVENLGAAFNRADELGGEARDYLQRWLQESEVAERVRGVVRSRKTKTDDSVAEPAATEPAAAEAASVTAPEPAPSLGDPSKAAQVFGARSCPWSGRAVRLLEDRDIGHAFIDLDDPDNVGLSARLVSETKQKSVPYIFVRGRFVGGYNALAELDGLGQLADEREDRVAGRVKIEVAERPSTDEVAPGEVTHPSDEIPPVG